MRIYRAYLSCEAGEVVHYVIGEDVLGAVLFGVGLLFRKCTCQKAGGSGGQQCSNCTSDQSNCCNKDSNKCVCDGSCRSITFHSTMITAVIAFSFLIAMAIYFFRHADYAPHLKSALKSASPSS